MAAITLHATGRSSTGVEREGARAESALTAEPARITAQFRPLDPGILNETIPAYFIGRNKEGFWVARDVNGQMGGIFLLENSALSFARRNSGPAGCATIHLSDPIELDLENRGNPLVVRLGRWMRLAMHLRRRMVASVKTTETVKRRLKDF
jgi:hypothetical protein